MRKAKALTASDGLTREEQLQQEVANLRKSLAYQRTLYLYVVGKDLCRVYS